MKRLFLLIIPLMLLACNNRNSTPKGLLPKEKMVSILIEMHMLEGKLNTLNLKRDSLEKLYYYYEHEVYAKHEVSDSVYLKSYEHYLSQPKQFESIYAAVVDSLSLQERLQSGK